MLGEAQKMVLDRVLERKLHGDSNLLEGIKAECAGTYRILPLMLTFGLPFFAVAPLLSSFGQPAGVIPFLIFAVVPFACWLIWAYFLVRFLLPLGFDMVGVVGFFHQRLPYVRASDIRELVALRRSAMFKDFARLRGKTNA